MKPTFLILLFFILVQGATAQTQVLQKDMPIFFNEIKLATQKNIQLWNKDLYAPLLLVDPKTRQVFANEADTTGILKANEGIFTGILPNKVNIANTSVNFGGKRWAMVMLPLPTNKEDRINLLAHELFHCAQPALGFALNNPENNHLDQKEGRIYLRLELEALKKAIQSTTKAAIQQHLNHALTFRAYRHELYPGSAATENQLELNEGLAEFTGMHISGRTREQAKTHFENELKTFLGNATFVRSFAYQTLPIYGYLLYDKNKKWHQRITAKTDLTDELTKAFGVRLPQDLKAAAEKLSATYNGKTIIEEETVRAEKIKKQIAEYRAKFIDQPHFEIKFEKMNVSFDPRNILPIADQGTVYPNIRVTDLWGILTVENGALMSPNWDKISISSPTQMEGKIITGDGWKLELTDAYKVEKDPASGHYKLIKNK